MMQALVRYKINHYSPSMDLLRLRCFWRAMKTFSSCMDMTSQSCLSLVCTHGRWFTDTSGYPHIGAWRVLASPNFFHDSVLAEKFGCAISISTKFSSSLKDTGSLICFICQTIWHNIIKMSYREIEVSFLLSCGLMLLPPWQQLLIMNCAHTKLNSFQIKLSPDAACSTILVKQKWHLCRPSGSYGIHPDGNNCWLQCLGLLKCILGSSPLSFPLCGAVGSYKDVFHRTTALVSHWPNSQPSIGLNGMIRKKLFILKL